MVRGTAVGADSAPSVETSITGPVTAVRGTRASTYFFFARSGVTATSSAAPGAPSKTTESVRFSALPCTRTRDPTCPAVTPMHPLRHCSALIRGAGPATAPPVGGAAAAGEVATTAARTEPSRYADVSRGRRSRPSTTAECGTGALLDLVVSPTGLADG